MEEGAFSLFVDVLVLFGTGCFLILLFRVRSQGSLSRFNRERDKFFRDRARYSSLDRGRSEAVLSDLTFYLLVCLAAIVGCGSLIMIVIALM